MFKYLIAGVAAAYVLYQVFFADDRDDRPPSPPTKSYEFPQRPVRRHDGRQYWENIESSQRDRRVPAEVSNFATLRARAQQASQQRDWEDIQPSQRDDRVRAEASHYESLRAKARKEGGLMTQCCQQSQEAYQRRDHARAKVLSEEGKRHAAKMEKLDAKASAIVFQENNQDRGPDEVDLHGLFVKEAIAYSKKAITDAYRRGDSEIRLIVGQGNHSEGGISRLRPEIQNDMQSHGHQVEIDPRNSGVLLVRLGGR